MLSFGMHFEQLLKYLFLIAAIGIIELTSTLNNLSMI